MPGWGSCTSQYGPGQLPAGVIPCKYIQLLYDGRIVMLVPLREIIERDVPFPSGIDQSDSPPKCARRMSVGMSGHEGKVLEVVGGQQVNDELEEQFWDNFREYTEAAMRSLRSTMEILSRDVPRVFQVRF